MLRAIDNYYLEKEEPVKSTLVALRDIILSLDKDISTSWKYQAPFFSYKGKMFCYLWTDKKNNEPYIEIVEGNRINHPDLEKGNRKRMKILRINPNIDIPVEIIELILNQALGFYKSGLIKTSR